MGETPKKSGSGKIAVVRGRFDHIYADTLDEGAARQQRAIAYPQCICGYVPKFGCNTPNRESR
jgi:hypothetical protein